MIMKNRAYQKSEKKVPTTSYHEEILVVGKCKYTHGMGR
jgi:hypothetical protein